MACVLRLMRTASGVATEFDGKYVKNYDPTIRCPDGSYDGGLLEVTDNAAEAMRFPDVCKAFEKWRQRYGWRPDGQWNRPLTAWSVSVETAPDAYQEGK